MNAQWRRRRRTVAPSTHDTTADEASVTTAILAMLAGTLLTLALGASVMAELDEMGPSVGGLIVFRPHSAQGEQWSVTADVTDASRSGFLQDAGETHCLLNPRVMSGEGGSLVIEARQMSRPPVYRVHWAGGVTDTGPGDCGRAADLVLPRADLMRLASAAGGFGGGLKLIGP